MTEIAINIAVGIKKKVTMVSSTDKVGAEVTGPSNIVMS
jgi:hypothetical protein